MKKRLASILLALVMLLSLLPAAALAETGTEDNPYLVADLQDGDIVNGADYIDFTSGNYGFNIYDADSNYDGDTDTPLSKVQIMSAPDNDELTSENYIDRGFMNPIDFRVGTSYMYAGWLDLYALHQIEADFTAAPAVGDTSVTLSLTCRECIVGQNVTLKLYEGSAAVSGAEISFTAENSTVEKTIQVTDGIAANKNYTVTASVGFTTPYVETIASFCDSDLNSWANSKFWNFDWYTDPTATEFTISDEQQFAAFAAIVNGDAKTLGYTQTTFSGKTVKLAADIDLTGKAWKPIGNIYCSAGIFSDTDADNPIRTETGSGYFAGAFDGDNHSISYKITENDNYYDKCGLFNYIYGGSVGNLVVNVTASFPSTYTVNTFALNEGEYREVSVDIGGLTVNADNGAHIYGVTVNGEINNRSFEAQAGGIAHFAGNVYFENCVNNANIHIGQYYRTTTTYQYALAGGIVCQSNAGVNNKLVFDNCINHGNIEIENPFDNPALTTWDGYGSGKSGDKYSMKLNAGGLVGQISGGSNYPYVVVGRNCYSDGTIVGSSIEKFSDGTYVSRHPSSTGSFVGKMWEHNDGTPIQVDYTVSKTDNANEAFYPNDRLFLVDSIDPDSFKMSDYVTFKASGSSYIIDKIADNYFYRASGYGSSVVYHTADGNVEVTEEQLAKLNESCGLMGTVVYLDVCINQLPEKTTDITITLDPNGGALAEASSFTVSADGKYPTLPTPTKEGGRFLGWYGVSKWTGSQFKVSSGQDVNVCEDTTLVAMWKDEIAQIGDTIYPSLEAAVAAAKDGDTVVLLADITYATNGNGLFNITKSITIDGNDHSISGYGSRSGNKTTLAINNGGTNEVNVTLKNLTINNAGFEGRPIETRGNIGTFTLDNVTINATGGGNTQCLTIGGSQNTSATVIIKNSSIDADSGGYPVITFNPVTMDIQNSTFNGYCSLYLKAPLSSAGSYGSVITAANSTFNAPNASNYGSNDFGAFVLETDDIDITLTDCSINAECTGTANQAVVQEANVPVIKLSNPVKPYSVTIQGDNTVVKGVILDPSDNKNAKGTVYLKGGKYTINNGNFSGNDGFVLNSGYSSDRVSVTGGLYNIDPSQATQYQSDPAVKKNYLASGYASLANTDEATKASYPYKVVPVLTMEGYAYDTTPKTPGYPTIDGATATVYYSSKTFLDTENKGIEWKNITGTTLIPGNYFMKAVYTENGVIVAETPQTTFTITKGTQAAPTAPTTSGNIVTVAQADRNVANKTLEYAIGGKTNWMPVPKLSADGTFAVSGLAAGDHAIYLRWRENSLYNASAASEGASMTLTQFSVAYNANYGVGSIASQTANTGTSITVASGDALSRTGYTFNAWNTEANGTGTAYAVGSTISTGMTLYAQWTANSYTISFNSDGGSAVDPITTESGKTVTLPTPTKSGFTFAGWATRADGPVVYLSGQIVKNLAASGTVTLYAVWTQNTGTVTGTIKTGSVEPMTLELKRGATVIETKEVTPSGGNASVGFAAVPYGTYNLVITQGNVVVTQIIVNSDSTNVGTITMPDSNVNSLLEVKGEDTQPVVVGNLDKEAESKAEEDKNVFVVMTVEKQEEQELPETATAQEQTTQEAIVKIKETAVTETKDTVTQEVSAAAAAAITEDTVQVEFLNITVEKYVGATTMTLTTLNTATTTETVTETNNVIEIVVPYDMSGKENIIVYRYHDNTATALEKLSEKPTGSFADGKYFLDVDNDLIYIYTQKFSTYGISYTEPVEQPEPPTPHHGGGGVTSYTVTVESARNGSISVDKKNASSGSTVTITVKPDKGFTLETLTVLDKNGKEVEVKSLGNNKFSFKMPRSKVSVEATFMEDNTMLNFFVDVKATDYFYDAVLWAAENGITKGTDALHFSPAAPVTRAQAVTFLWRAAGCPKPATELNPFTDVKADAYYYEAVLWAVENGITKGTTDTTFSPDKVCTRAHIVTFLARFAGVEDTDTGYTHGFTDVKTADYFNNAVAWAKENKVTEGTTPTSFSPNHNCTRAQVVTFIYRWMVK